MSVNMAACVRDKLNIHMVCQLCGAIENLMICAGCRNTWYCSKEHQRFDWKYHKAKCKSKRREKSAGNIDSVPGTPSGKKHDSSTSNGIRDRSKVVENVNKSLKTEELSQTDENGDDTLKDMNNAQSEELATTDVDLASMSSDVTAETQKLTISSNQAASSQATNETFTEQGSSESYILFSNESALKAPNYSAQMPIDTENLNMCPQGVTKNTIDTSQTYFSVLESRNEMLGEYVVNCLNRYGISVIDNFLGESKGMAILDQVKDLHSSDVFTRGQLVNRENGSTTRSIRDDLITWVDGYENNCDEIQFLISSMDAIVLQCAGKLSNCSINGRTKAMVACYPGPSSGYVRHVDNPHKDGRCVTCIYYLNKDWDTMADGGALRIYPEGENRIACIEPKFDRLLFFWSDRRNPHEVLPTKKTRYAITVWYYDAAERSMAVKRYKEPKNLSDHQRKRLCHKNLHASPK